MSIVEQIDATHFRHPGDPFTALFGGELGIRIVGVNGEATVPAGYVLVVHDYQQSDGTIRWNAYLQTEDEFNGKVDLTEFE